MALSFVENVSTVSQRQSSLNKISARRMKFTNKTDKVRCNNLHLENRGPNVVLRITRGAR